MLKKDKSTIYKKASETKWSSYMNSILVSLLLLITLYMSLYDPNIQSHNLL